MRNMKRSVKRWTVRGYVASQLLMQQNYNTANVQGIDIQFEYVNPKTFLQTRNAVSGEATREGVSLDLLDGDYDGIIDVGAHIGIYSVILGVIHPGTELFLYEPAKPPRQLLQRNLELNGLRERAYINSSLVAGETGIMEPFNEMADVGSPSSGAAIDSQSATETQKTVALSDVIATEKLSHPFMKIDAEGKEEEIIPDIVSQEATDSLSGIVEIHPDKLTESTENELLRLFRDHGFICEHVVDTSPNPEVPRPIYRFETR